MSTWKLDPSHSDAEFCARHLMICGVRGLLHGISGTLEFDPAHPEQGAVEVAIEASTLSSGNPERDEHLKSADFLDVANHPTLRFRSTGVTPTKNLTGTWARVDGELTLRGIARPVTFAVSWAGPVKDPWKGNEHVGFTAAATIDKRDFDMHWNADLADGLLIANEVAISINVEFVREA